MRTLSKNHAAFAQDLVDIKSSAVATTTTAWAPPDSTPQKKSRKAKLEDKQKASHLVALNCEGFVAYKVSAVKFIP
ncbi:hypothetical protein [Pseudobdellovibrio exovorus]|uniref:Uncharacterized protein n=1 Tax=Pseudobdellovibrio exovorus JSS TaxID=1184267 RepID=M4VU67_9BACT|nr:hypothetical protein [Pseudobdellovibrio exovorus]AGH96759.1 hypothetical protein A11Q_2543 [Pseudobdellovibrio exovorus JSS]